MAEKKRGRGRPKKNPVVVDKLTVIEEHALLEAVLAMTVILREYQALKHPSINQIMKLNEANMQIRAAFHSVFDDD